jgi:hypothetical protein
MSLYKLIVSLGILPFNNFIMRFIYLHQVPKLKLYLSYLGGGGAGVAGRVHQVT